MTAEPGREILLGILTTMTRIKACDERFRSMLMSGQVAFPFYSPRGQEAISASYAACLQPDDYVVTTYRGLHDHIAKGVPMDALWAECLGRSGGTCKGKGGPMHITHPASGLMVTTGVVGSGIPIANGLALAAQLRGDGRVTVCNFGDGASNIGAFHEALNMAALWKLPVVFVCQNNGYAESTTYAKGTSATSIADRGAAYGMPGIAVDGNDVLAMHSAARTAVDRARSGEGPTLVEAKTFRLMGHYFGDPGDYIPPEQYAAALERDPLPVYRSWLVTRGHATEPDLDAIEAAAEDEVDRAVAYAQASPGPGSDELLMDVYGERLVSA